MKMEEMRDRITFQTPKIEESPVKSLKSQYDDFVTVWAKVEYLKGREFWEAKAVNAETTVRFIIRYRKNISNDMRVLYDNKFYSITSVMLLDNTRKWLVVLGSEVVNSGV